MFLIGLLAVLVIWVSRDKQPDDIEWWVQERNRVDLAQRLKVQEFRYEQAAPRFAQEDLGKRRLALKALRDKAVSLAERRDELKAETAAIEKEMGAFRKTSLANLRSSHVGLEFEEFRSRGGRVYRDVKVVAVGDAGVTIQHGDGMARLGFGDLTPEQRVFFGLEEEAFTKAVERESKAAADYLGWLEARMEEIEAEQDANYRRKLALAKAEQQREPARLNWSSATAGRSVSALSQPARPIGDPSASRRVRYRRSTRYYYVYPATNYRAAPQACSPYFP